MVSGFGYIFLTSSIPTGSFIQVLRDTLDSFRCLSRSTQHKIKWQEITDRGFVFYPWRGVNHFEKYLKMKGVDQIHTSPYHPQTLALT